MNKKISPIILLSSLFMVSCSSGTVNNASAPNITAVKVWQQNSDKLLDGVNTTQNFSVFIDFYTNSTLENWKFGFYMPRTFNTVQNSSVAPPINVNPNLTMNIFDNNGNKICGLSYLVESSVTVMAQSSGYTNILVPSGSCNLQANTKYEIRLEHTNTWLPGNYSGAPQSFFFNVNGTVINVPTSQSVYNFADYNSTTVNNNVNTHLNTQWTNTNSNVSASAIVPSPESYLPAVGNYTIASGIAIHNNLNQDNAIANYFKVDLASDLNISATVDNLSSASSGIIIKQITDPNIINNNPEGYQIIISSASIQINALNQTGAYYALQTLRQLWSQNNGVVANATIVDYPRFQYRGVLLDTARHFLSVTEIQNIIDITAAHKLNTIHMHFSDDEGFRLGLTQLSQFAANGIATADSRGYGLTLNGMMAPQYNLGITNNPPGTNYPFLNTVYSGTYSMSDLQQIVSYANQHMITIIPEVDMPGHALAMIAGFPNTLVDPNDQSTFISVQGYINDVLPVCTYNTQTTVGPQFTSFVNTMLQQLATAFNGQSTLYAVSNEVSVGGDEVSSGAWSNDSSCTGAWASKDALAKSQLFFGLVSQNNPSLKISGWQQYVQADAPNTTIALDGVQSANAGHVWVWTPYSNEVESQAAVLAAAGYPVVLAYANQTYFDLAYTPAIDELGFTWAHGYLNTYSALSSAVSATNTINNPLNTTPNNIKGIEGTLWSENIPTYDHLIYMALPKMAGLAEASWSPQSTTNGSGPTAKYPNWQDLTARLGCGQTGFLAYLNKIFNVQYRGYPNGIGLEVPAGTCALGR